MNADSVKEGSDDKIWTERKRKTLEESPQG